MNDNMKKLQQKRELVAKTIRREKTDKIPFMITADSYIPIYSGVKLTDITTYDKAVEVNKKFFDEVEFDCMEAPYIPQNLLFAPLMEALGGGCHVVKDAVKQVNPKAIKIMEPEEYAPLIKDPENYLLDTLFAKRFEVLRTNDLEAKRNGFLAALDDGFSTYLAKCEEFGMPILQTGLYINPVDIIFGILRDFSGIMRDVRKRPEEVRDAGLAMVKGISSMVSFIDPQPQEHKVISCYMHLPTFINAKHFEKVYWPSFKALTEDLVNKGYNILFSFEKNYEHLYDYLQELPKKGIIGMFEEDDLRVAKKKLGNTMAIMGGLSINTLQYGTKEECIDNVKSLINDLAPGGGYFIAPDRPMMYASDGKPENLRAVAEYISKFGYNK